MDPKQWGPPAWKFLRAIAHHYPETPYPDEKQHMIQFLSTLTYILPCTTCQGHYKEYLQSHPPEVHSRTTLLHWLHDLHSTIHQRNRKTAVSYYNFLYPLHRRYNLIFWIIMCLGILVCIYFHKHS